MLSNLIYEKIPKTIAKFKKNKRIKPDRDPVKVNIGSGLQVYKDWYNVDADFNILFRGMPVKVIELLWKKTGIKNWYKKDEFISLLKNNTYIYHNLEFGIPFEDNSIDYIYSSHFLEHIFRSDAKKILKEAFRTLKKGGIIRTCVPDLEYAIKLYHEGQKELALDYFFKSEKADYLTRHQYLYDFELLKELHEEAGFINVVRCKFKEGKTPDIEYLDNREEETLFLEAEKP